MDTAFDKLSGLPTQAKRFTAGDNLLRQKIAFDRMAAKHEQREKMLAGKEDSKRDGSLENVTGSPLNNSLSPARLRDSQE